jgi:hypothetical protein
MSGRTSGALICCFIVALLLLRHDDVPLLAPSLEDVLDFVLTLTWFFSRLTVLLFILTYLVLLTLVSLYKSSIHAFCGRILRFR